MKITVKHPLFTLKHDSIFTALELDRQIQCDQFPGIFADDIRFLSHDAG